MFSGEQVMNDALDLQSQALSLQVAGIKLIAGFEEWWLGPESNRGAAASVRLCQLYSEDQRKHREKTGLFGAAWCSNFSHGIARDQG